MNQTIRAAVNPRLLTKASRLFTGSLRGRIIEILQNARRAGATEVHITNADGVVTVRDNGKGIDDFGRLLDLGGSGWPPEEGLENSEDPAGVGLFCLAPRKLFVRSQGFTAMIDGDGWTGGLVPLTADPHPGSGGAGTTLTFEDEEWNHSVVEPLAVFTGMSVTVDGKACPRKAFLPQEGTDLPGLGCRLLVTDSAKVTDYHRQAAGEHHPIQGRHEEGTCAAATQRRLTMHTKVIVTETGAAVEVARVIHGKDKGNVEQHAREQLRQIIRQVLKNHPNVSCNMAEALRRGYWWADLGSEEFTVMVLEPQHAESLDQATIEVDVEGGVITDVNAPPDIDVTVRDYDTEGVEQDRLEQDSDGRPCVISHWKGGAP